MADRKAPVHGAGRTEAVKYIYSLYDVKTGALAHRGRPQELVEAGVFTQADEAARCYGKQKKRGIRPRKWRVEREAEKPKPRAKPEARPKNTQKRRVWEYSLYGMGGKLLTQGIAQELVAAGLFPRTQDVANAYRRGYAPEVGAQSISRKKVERTIRCKAPGALKEPRKKPGPPQRKKMPLRHIEHPDELQVDVHELCQYNAVARAAGKRELSYGYWAAKGKPQNI